MKCRACSGCAAGTTCNFVALTAEVEPALECPSRLCSAPAALAACGEPAVACGRPAVFVANLEGLEWFCCLAHKGPDTVRLTAIGEWYRSNGLPLPELRPLTQPVVEAMFN